MTKKESLLKLIISLTLITLVAGIALAAVFSVTKEPIEKMKLENKNAAIKLVLSGFEGEIAAPVELTLNDDKQPVIIYPAFQDGELYAVAIETFTNKAFSGYFSIMVGLDANGVILGTEVLQANETPGLGDKIDKKKSDFPLQFVGKNLNNFILKVKKDGGEIDAITASTITSRAFCDAIDRAFHAFQSYSENLTENKKEASNE